MNALVVYDIGTTWQRRHLNFNQYQKYSFTSIVGGVASNDSMNDEVARIFDDGGSGRNAREHSASSSAEANLENTDDAMLFSLSPFSRLVLSAAF